MKREDLFHSLIKILDCNDIAYAIVGKTEAYPQKISSDIDIIIPKSMISKFHSAIWLLETSSTKIVQMFQHEITAFYYIVFDFSNSNRLYIQPDVCTDYYRKGRKLLNAEYLLQNTIEAPQGGFKILSPEKEFIYYLLKKIDKQNISEEQFEHILHCYTKDVTLCIKETKSFWREKDVFLIQEIFKNGDYNLFKNNIRILQTGIHSSRRVSYRDFITNTFLKIKRIIHPTGYIISILGPDGSGKTTVINQLKKDLSPAFRKVQQYHLFPKKEDNNSINQNPQGQEARGTLLSILKLCYFVYLYNWGYLKLIYPAKIKSTLTIFDRYYDDILIDPIRYRNGTSQKTVIFFGHLIPRPQLWIVLDAPTDVIQKRKTEVTPTETERQRNAYIAFTKSKKNCLLVNTNQNIENISNEICQFICQALNERATKRYKK